MRAWTPITAHSSYGDPQPGELIAHTHTVWRVRSVEPLPLDDEDREAWQEAGQPDVLAWPKAPRRITAAYVGGARPSWAPPDGPVPDGRFDRRARHRALWYTYPASGRWPSCSCCGEPMPCRADLTDAEVAASMAVVEQFTRRQPGSCWACGETVNPRQRYVDYPGDNLDLPGGPPVRFHTRRRCLDTAHAYERRWVDGDPARQRLLTWPQCAGVLVVHADGTSECRPGGGLLAHLGEPVPGCLGHSTHDHRAATACYTGGVVLAEAPGCPRGCRPQGHPGTHPADRVARRPARGSLDAAS
jgi:hypothetical protein